MFAGSLNAWNAICIGKNSENVMESLVESFGTEENNEKTEGNESEGRRDNLSKENLVSAYPNFIKCLRKHFPNKSSESVISEEAKKREKQVSNIMDGVRREDSLPHKVADQDIDSTKNWDISKMSDEVINQSSDEFWEFEVYSIMRNSNGDVCSVPAEPFPSPFNSSL